METGQLPLRQEGADSHDETTSTGQLACVQCRSRKLKCDRNRPACNRCVKQNETCNYPGSRLRALGPRKTVRELEKRIEELEALLRAADLRTAQETAPDLSQGRPPPAQDFDLFDLGPLPLHQDLPFGQPQLIGSVELSPPQQSANQLIDLGLFEQLPSFDVVDELNALYFQKIHPGAPMLHRASYTAGLRLPPHMRPPMCLQYIVMASAAATSDTYRHLSEPFYLRARIYAEADELKGQGEAFTTLAHVQSWCLISAYECHVYALFTRASTSLCRGVRVAQMLRLHQLDIRDPETLRSGLPPPRSWIEAEERRRTWWVVFLADRYLTSTTGWPSLIDERHIRTNLPSTEESFAAGGTNELAIPLSGGLRELAQGRGAQVPPLAVRILAANELLHCLDHASRRSPESGSEDVRDGPYWQRHREIDANLSTLTIFLPERLHLARNPRSLDAILVHVSTNMATIHLHRTALGRIHHHRRSPDLHLVAQSQARLLPAAEGILAVFRAAGDGVGTAIRNPLLSFAAYMAASVFLEDYFQAAAGGSGADVQDRSRQSEASLEFLARILVFFARSSPLVRANAFQLAADMKRTGYGTALMDQLMSQSTTAWGSTSEILLPSSKGLPMVFCPALTSAPGLSESPGLGLQGVSSFRGHGGGGSSISSFFGPSPTVPMRGPSATGLGIAPPLLQQAGSPDGLFSQFTANPGSSLL
ncbi:fungal-specific transcription factor domain-containing protein [Lasiosphaeria miniovina]|uniref:Fungal-specific transcription factor domain-containing protein n=1 Tax=Lasiosphaeria miniovina TaxID=1954250 RepID=A0AA40DJC7_9PEZI|nr:fungal-specific transcription factor domain-containing protein [Lasiosphaeria miniovina]KAK0702063.1 fungal-specific transcription factor domain-containing protein [Lasiosphaeria miniovina]